MMPPCAKCNKTVYPTEKFSCLDKIWHKLCFKCDTCGMQLNLKNYKGYKKIPYCTTHYPDTGFTPIKDTPENLRLKQNTTNQSGAVYHQEFKNDIGKVTVVADDPETLRAKKSQQQASEVKYQESFKKDVGKITAVADDPETMRAKKSQEQASEVKYKGWLEGFLLLGDILLYGSSECILCFKLERKKLHCCLRKRCR